MRVIPPIVALLLILSWWAVTVAQDTDPGVTRPVIVSDEEAQVPLGRYLEILEDPSGELTIDEVASGDFAAQFTPSQVDVPNFGFTDSAYRVRLPLENRSGQTMERLLEVGLANMQFVDLYTPLPDGGFSVKQTGALRPPASRDVLHPRTVFEVAVPPNTEEAIYLRFQNGVSMTLPITLWAREAFRMASQREHMLQGLFFGALFILLVYNLFLWLSLRTLSYFYLVMLLASMIVFESGYTGYRDLYLLPRLYHLRLYFQSLSFSLLFVSMLLFADEFLELKVNLPRLHWLMMINVAAWGVLILLIPFVSYRTLAGLMVPLVLPSVAIILVTGTISWWRGSHYTRFFMLAWSGLLVAFFFIVLTRLGAISSSIVIENGYRLGVLWMSVLWSLALADRVNLLQTETMNANLALKDSENRLSQILEGLPVGVVVYGTDQKPKFANRRLFDILSNPVRDIVPDISAERTLSEAMAYFSIHIAGSEEPYPLDEMPIYRALLGEPAAVEDAEADLIDRRVPLEIWANPVKDISGNVESAVVAIHDISQRKATEAERDEYRRHLEAAVTQRTAERQHLQDVLVKVVTWLSEVSRVQRSFAEQTDLRLVQQDLLHTIRRIMGAENVFTCLWGSQDDHVEILCSRRVGPPASSHELTLTELRQDSSPRREMERNELLIVPVEEGSPLLTPLASCLDYGEVQSVVLVPIELDSTVLGLLGLGLNHPAEALTAEEKFLLGRMGTDLAAVADYARLNEAAMLLAAADERNRLARDLHDSVTQVLFSATLVAEVLPKIWQKDPERAMKSLDNLRRLTYSGLAELRTMLLELRPSAVLNTPLSELLAQLTEAITSRASLSFQLFLEQSPPLPEAVHAAFYRIAQESLNNVVKHAQAGHVTVSLNSTKIEADGADRYQVTLEVRDNGVGYVSKQERPGHLGIGIMHERAVAVGANLSLESQPGEGTCVTLAWCGSPQGEGSNDD